MKPKKSPSLAKIREWLEYDPTTGVFTWLKRSSLSLRVGNRAGHVGILGYRTITIEKTRYKAHRLTWVYVHGKEPQEVLDHINGDKDDNRICNLREATYSGNSRSCKLRRGSISGYKGVRPSGAKLKPWRAQIKFEGKFISLGNYADPYEAHLVYCAAATKYYGEFARFA